MGGEQDGVALLVEFGDESPQGLAQFHIDARRWLVQPHLVDAVLIAVEAEQSAVAMESRAVQRIEHGVRCEP